MEAVGQALTRHKEGKLEGTECLLGWDWISLMGMRITMNLRILEPERILVTLLILQIRKRKAQKCEGEMRPPSPPNSKFSLENLLLGKSSAAITKSHENTVALRIHS